MENIRTFLEPNSDHPPPELYVTSSMEISLGSDNGIYIEDAVRAFYTFPSHPCDHLIQNIFITHFDEAIVILRDVVEKSYSNTITIQWVLHTINNIILFLSTPNQLALLWVSARTIQHFGAILARRESDWEWVLSTLGRNNKALAAAQEAVSVYSENVLHMWGNNLYTIRKQELGANAFHTLSLRLVISEKPGQALLHAEKATELYRELVALAPRHLPTLTSSLQNLGSILWDVGRRDKAVAACEEAVGIMRKVSSSETYFLPTLAEALEQLAGYLGEKGDVGGASAAAAECAEVRREFAVLPPEPEFLFEKVVDMMESDDEWETSTPACVSEADDKYHDASEGPSVEAVESDDEADEYHDASEPPTSIKPLALISEFPSRSSTSTPGPATDIDAPVQANPAGDSATVTGLDGSSTLAVQNPTATDTAKSIFSQPLEVNVKLRLRSTLMDIVWWVLLGISFAIAAIAWRRVA
ncbi:hypothetical protein DFH08DRAFT_959249 [Mycena albidolilacea]|uniref:Uncharacterized protein n=1 Tax=Mycena albidolilacea TaxID=1033008 RepID=A0AAD7A4T9_9AGAR|nr:hypothetical protein DFH08DRAFT_959249 [Mycena albidolilacea]